jgi:PAB-dependent poly(A)-specific ribonuclease subunit 2
VRGGEQVALARLLISSLCSQEEAEFHSDGTKKVIRPSRMTLARVSVLRGEGPDTGIPFIDDHIHTSDTIVDYLTEFSGIRGELMVPLWGLLAS